MIKAIQAIPRVSSNHAGVPSSHAAIPIYDRRDVIYDPNGLLMHFTGKTGWFCGPPPNRFQCTMLMHLGSLLLGSHGGYVKFKMPCRNFKNGVPLPTPDECKPTLTFQVVNDKTQCVLDVWVEQTKLTVKMKSGRDFRCIKTLFDKIPQLLKHTYTQQVIGYMAVDYKMCYFHDCSVGAGV